MSDPIHPSAHVSDTGVPVCPPGDRAGRELVCAWLGQVEAGRIGEGAALSDALIAQIMRNEAVVLRRG